MKNLLLIAAILATITAQAQKYAGFENIEIELDTFYNNAEGPGFNNDILFFRNAYNPEFASWSNWAISTMRDTITAGFGNQYSSYAGGGKNSTNYGVASAFFPVNFSFREASEKLVTGIFLTNNTYSALSMKDGDAFAKKFGGESGNDPDFFLVTIKKWLDGELSADSIDFYLADYRFENNDRDYIIKDWTFVDLSSLGMADSIEFALSSSDVGAFGMNTPAFFCVDDVVLDIESSTEFLGENIDLKIYPNPSSDVLYVNGLDDKDYEVEIYDSAGRLTKRLQKQVNGYIIKTLTNGNYFFVVNVDGVRFSTLFVKQ